MEGSSKDWAKFEERDRLNAKNFAEAASHCGVKRIIYLGGLTNEKDPEKLSPHMKSRWEVGEILKRSTAKVTIFRAAVILGYGGGSYEMLSYLVERLPVMVCPRWVLTESQPIAIDDVVDYLTDAIEVDATAGQTYDIGGPEKLTYLDMMKRFAKITGRSLRVIIVPFLTPRLSSYWVDLVTPVRAALARPLIDSLKHEAVVEDDSIQKLIPLHVAGFDEAITRARTEETMAKSVPKSPAAQAGIPASLLATISALLAATLINTVWLGRLGGSLSIIPEAALMYAVAIVSSFFLVKGARLGSLLAGVYLWLSAGVVLLELLQTSEFFAIDLNGLLILSVIVWSVGIVGAHVRFHETAPSF